MLSNGHRITFVYHQTKICEIRFSSSITTQSHEATRPTKRKQSSRGKRPGYLHPLEIPEYRWCDISMDILVRLPETTSSKFDSILVIVDRLTK
ncbi:hypothetical protein PHMEG_0008764 [Phytophthora megakarya]|uniref:Reverse transcriptase n=1 Tax=Phytophthora megakarya TaxID=4795 RepID=A0A225WJ91_9STRA|nr:hypothetical protein PHMEG_0008764 [Phytophthora megakarya]